MPNPELIASIYRVLLLLGGCCCLVWDVQGSHCQKDYGLEPWKIRLFDFAAFFLGLFAVQMVGQGIGAVVFKALAGSEASWPYGTVFGFLASQLGVLVLFLLILRNRGGLGLVASPARLRPSAALRHGGFYFLAALPLLSAASLGWQQLLVWLRTLGWGTETPYQPLVEKLTELHGWTEWTLVFLMAGVVAPVVEELMFRCALYRFLKNRIHPLLALTVSSLFFALMHLNLLQFIPLFLLAMLLGRAYERTGSLLVPICFHACFNLNTLLVIAIAPQIIQQSPV